jgi:hypothetical protein
MKAKIICKKMSSNSNNNSFLNLESSASYNEVKEILEEMSKG